MAKTQNLIKGALLSAAVLAPVAGAYANSVRISVQVAPVANVSVVSEQSDGKTIYTATVATNSIDGFDLLVSSDNGNTYSLFKTVNTYPKPEEKIITAISDRNNLKFKAVPHENR